MISRILVRLFGGIWNVKNKATQNKLYAILYNYYQFEHGSAIAIGAAFNNEPLFPRGMKQIIISENAKIGENCVIYQQVTIDGELLPNEASKSGPVIGDNCYIYPGAKIIGNITIGNNVIISPNAVIVKDVADNSYV
jgi:serine O-acetyltransferase